MLGHLLHPAAGGLVGRVNPQDFFKDLEGPIELTEIFEALGLVEQHPHFFDIGGVLQRCRRVGADWIVELRARFERQQVVRRDGLIKHPVDRFACPFDVSPAALLARLFDRSLDQALSRRFPQSRRGRGVRQQVAGTRVSGHGIRPARGFIGLIPFLEKDPGLACAGGPPLQLGLGQRRGLLGRHRQRHEETSYRCKRQKARAGDDGGVETIEDRHRGFGDL